MSEDFEDEELIERKDRNPNVYHDENSNMDFIIPEDFIINEETKSIYRVSEDGIKRVSHNLIFPIAIINNLDDGTEKIKLQLEKRGIIKEGIFVKSQVYSSPFELANFGIPVNATNAKNMIKFLAEMEAENEDAIPVIKAVSKLGWRDGHFIPFSRDSDIVVDIDYKLEKWINAYTSKGTLEDWVEKMKPFRKNAIFRFVLASAFTAPLLKIIGHRIFIVYIWRKFKSRKKFCVESSFKRMGKSK